jgi:hypothetical protein
MPYSRPLSHALYLLTFIVCLVIWLAPVGQAQVQQASCTFTLFLLEPSSPSNPSFNINNGTGVNDWKTVVGEAYFNFTQTPPFSKGFIHYAGGGTSYYSAPGAIRTRFSARNNKGVTAGVYADSSNAEHSFILQGSTLTPIVHPSSFPNTTMVQGINNFNTTVGTYSSVGWGGAARGFKRYSNGKFVSFSYPGAQGTGPAGINDSGVIVGRADGHGFLYHNGQWATLDYPGASGTQLLGISNAGVIIGVAYSSVGSPVNFMYANGIFKSIDIPNSSLTQVWGISASGVITGTADFNQGFTAICH